MKQSLLFSICMIGMSLGSSMAWANDQDFASMIQNNARISTQEYYETLKEGEIKQFFRELFDMADSDKSVIYGTPTLISGSLEMTNGAESTWSVPVSRATDSGEKLIFRAKVECPVRERQETRYSKSLDPDCEVVDLI